jgi:pimeloyl-ACP methyl ester carboxylesterase
VDLSCEAFDRQLAHYTDSKDYLAVSYDPRAHGRSSQTQGGHYYEQHARDLRALVQAVGKSRIVLVGWSAGGIEVLEYLRVFGHEDVAGVVIIDMPPKVRGHDMRTEWVFYGTIDDGDQDDLLRSFCFDLQMDRQAFNREGCASMLDNPDSESVRFFEEMSSNTTDLVAVQLIMSGWFVDDTAVAEKLDGIVPVMYFVREESKHLAENWAAQHAPHSQVHSHGEHAMFWEHPDVFNASLDQFLSRVTASEGSDR